MNELEYSTVCRNIIEQVGGVTANHEVVIVTDPTMVAIARPLAAASRAIGAAASILIKPRLEAHNVEPPSAVAGALQKADIVFDAGTHDIAHTDARRVASDAGTRFVLMRKITEDIMINQMDTDYKNLREVTRAVAAIQTAADSAQITSEFGTELTVNLSDRSGFPIDDGFDEGLVVLPAGKSAITPVEGSAQGTVVVDYSIDSIGLLDDPVELTINKGQVVNVSGGPQAIKLNELIDRKGDCARNIAEAPSIGTNPDVSLTGNQATDKKKRGTMHIAVGDNITLGGSVECNIHLDMTLSKATVRFDDFTVLDEGQFQKEAVIERAATLEDS
jgi:leucyl aminopeptidase (aminopeptidase T)